MSPSTATLGIYSSGGAIVNNRVFATAGSGIYASNANATGNVSYSNQVGIEGDNSPIGTNNLVLRQRHRRHLAAQRVQRKHL